MVGAGALNFSSCSQQLALHYRLCRTVHLQYGHPAATTTASTTAAAAGFTTPRRTAAAVSAERRRLSLPNEAGRPADLQRCGRFVARDHPHAHTRAPQVCNRLWDALLQPVLNARRPQQQEASLEGLGSGSTRTLTGSAYLRARGGPGRRPRGVLVRWHPPPRDHKGAQTSRSRSVHVPLRCGSGVSLLLLEPVRRGTRGGRATSGSQRSEARGDCIVCALAEQHDGTRCHARVVERRIIIPIRTDTDAGVMRGECAGLLGLRRQPHDDRHALPLGAEGEDLQHLV